MIYAYDITSMFEHSFVERMDGNEEIFTRLMNDDDFREIASKYLVKEVYQGIKENK